MKTFFKILLQIGLLITAFWGLIAFLQWDESDRKNAIVQILPYELNYTYEGEAESYRDANGWFARLFTLSENGQWEECYNDMLSLYDYEKLKSLSDQTSAGRHTYVIARVFKTKATGSTQCEVNVGDWDKFLNMAQPTEQSVREFNQRKQSEAKQPVE